MPNDSVQQSVLAAVHDLVSAFASNNLPEYFGSFSDDAEFIFYTHTERLYSRIAYENLWEQWVSQDGLKIISCKSSNQNVVLLGDEHALFTHDVETKLSTNSGIDNVQERESIVFRRDGGSWLAIHEHLSPLPALGA